MQVLRPFQGTLPFQCLADVSVEGSLLVLTYKLSACSEVHGLCESSHIFGSDEVPRADELWKTTCFEAFLSPVGSSSYSEFNFSLKPAWNAYEFAGYRSPQPPIPAKGFQILQMSWDTQLGLLTVQLENLTEFREFNISLTAVIELKDHSKHYLAVTHAEDKPDFHSAKSFTLRRGKNR